MKRNKKKNYVLIFSFIVTLCVIFLSVGFSAFQASMEISNITAMLREQKDVRITNLRYTSVSNGATILDYNYSANSINGIITLPNNNSTVTFQVEVTNIGNVEVGFLEISDLTSPFTYEIVGYTEGTKLCDDENSSQCKLGTVSTFDVSIKYIQGASVISTPTFFTGSISFKEAYNITYMNITNQGVLPSVILKDETLSITFQNDVPYDLKITRGDGSTLASGSYTYTASSGNSKVLTISYVSSNLTIDRYYSITYELNGSTNNGSNPGKYLRSDTITINDPTYDSSHTFYGWYETSDFSSSVITSTNQLTGDTILYAKWLSETELYTIDYVLNGGTQASGQVTSYYASTPQTILSPSRANYEFDGWYSSSTFSGSAITSTSQLSGNTTLYAKWVEVYAITYNVGSGTQASGQIVSFRADSAPQTLLNPTNNHDANFVGWFTATSGGTQITSTGSITSSTTLYARWDSTISNASFTDSNYTFTATNNSNLGSYNNFSRNAVYTESSAHCVVNTIKVTLTISYSHKTATLPVTITNASGNTIGTGSISITNGATSVETTVTLNTPVQIGDGFTIGFGSFSGNANKLTVNGVSFVINP